MNNPRKPVTLPARVLPSDPLYTFEQYTPAQAAAYLKISRNVFYQLIAAEKVSYTRLSKTRIACSQRDLDSYNATRRHEVVMGAAIRLASSEHDRPASKSRYR